MVSFLNPLCKKRGQCWMEVSDGEELGELSVYVVLRKGKIRGWDIVGVSELGEVFFLENFSMGHNEMRVA